MTKLDLTKEKIAYLKLWLGIAVISDISLFTWLLTAGDETAGWLKFSGWLTVVIVTAAGFAMHKAIEAKIGSLEDL